MKRSGYRSNKSVYIYIYISRALFLHSRFLWRLDRDTGGFASLTQEESVRWDPLTWTVTRRPFEPLAPSLIPFQVPCETHLSGLSRHVGLVSFLGFVSTRFPPGILRGNEFVKCFPRDAKLLNIFPSNLHLFSRDKGTDRFVPCSVRINKIEEINNRCELYSTKNLTNVSSKIYELYNTHCTQV